METEIILLCPNQVKLSLYVKQDIDYSNAKKNLL